MANEDDSGLVRSRDVEEEVSDLLDDETGQAWDRRFREGRSDEAGHGSGSC